MRSVVTDQVRKGKERKSIYIAPFRTKVLTKRSGMDHTVLPANNTMPAFLCKNGRIVAWSVCQSVSGSVTLVGPAKTAEQIEMLFELRTRVGPRNHGKGKF